MEAFVRGHHVITLVAALAIGIGAVKVVAQNNLGVAIASPDKGSADRTEIASVNTPLRPVSGADGVERVDDLPLMGLDLNGPPKRFSAKEMLENLEIPGF
jgi:hypothetical protein